MEFHIARKVREAAEVDDLLFSYTGNVVFANVAASRKLAQALNAAAGADPAPEKTYHGGALFAMGLIDELSHALVARYREETDPDVLSEAVRWFAAQIRPEALDRLLLQFADEFPNVAVFRGEMTAAEWLAGSSDGMTHREAALEELLLLWLANRNAAFSPFAELFGEAGLQENAAYPKVTAGFPEYFSTRPPVSPEFKTLVEALEAPMLASPDSLTGQLDFIREHWTPFLGAELRRVLLAIDTLREEDVAIWMRFHPPGPDQYRHGAPGSGAEGFEGDEYVGFEGEWITGADGRRVRRYSTDYQAPLDEYEAFSADQAWMPNVVLMAKSTYVWLEQLSKKYRRHIHRLDQIPLEELQLMADRGMTGLWLIGLWERSVASRTIKRLRGHGDAVASAYSLKDYQIAEDLGGDEAYKVLRDRAASVGMRLASDMVPNHMGIDSPWVIENPDWFLHRWESPFPSYSFTGPDLSSDSRVEMRLEDHYYDQTDAAVVFQLRHHRDGTTRYVYHGNDGTTFAWNDTAQLDYSKAAVREHVIQVILHVAKLFPIIRFDAAMVLAKRHVQRLWFPLPGAGGSIPSRAENAMTQEEFDSIMPNEFWREVVDRVAVEVPGTLLLAEAFWMLEGYFVRTLGMHRVYNSAFMNMLRDEENAKYRSYLKKTIEFDPDILKRYVNFMSNPDERTTVDQFGDGDKAFGVAILMSTLPGLPMFGHGQIEGYTERYGMEYKQAKMDEWPNEGLVARHQHEIAPLLKQRFIFAESANFLLYDFWTEHGTVDENVFAYSNRSGSGERSLILYNNSYGSTRGTVHASAASMDKASGDLRERSLSDGLGLPWGDEVVFAYRDRACGLEFLRRANDFIQSGFTVDLRGYGYAVLLDWRELRSTGEQPWGELCDALAGSGVRSVDEALRKLRLRPMHDALRRVVSPHFAWHFAEEAERLRQTGALPASAEQLLQDFAAAGEEFASVLRQQLAGIKPAAQEGNLPEPASRLAMPTAHEEPGTVNGAARMTTNSKIGAKAAELAKKRPDPDIVAAALRIPSDAGVSSGASTAEVLPFGPPGRPREQAWAPVTAWLLLQAVTVEAFDRLELRSALADSFSAVGFSSEDGWREAAKVRLLLSAKSVLLEDAKSKLAEETFWADPDVRWLAGVHEAEGKTYFNRESFEALLRWLELPAMIDAASTCASGALDAVEDHLQARFSAAKGAGYDLDVYLAGSAAMAAPLTGRTAGELKTLEAVLEEKLG